jgi:hypothetical protein
MPKFTLIAEHTDNFGSTLSKTTHEFEVEFIGEVLENVDLFLRGTGFNPTGTLDYVEEEFNTDNLMDEDYFGDGHEGMGSTLENYPEIQQDVMGAVGSHSEYYFDTDRNQPVSPWPFKPNGETK